MWDVLLALALFGLSLWALDALDFNRMIKKGRVMQAQTLYLFMAMGLASLVFQFLKALIINK